MDGTFWLNVFSRWVHVSSAVLGAGSLMLLGWALLPAGAEGAPVSPAVLRRFKRLFHIAMGLLLLSGAYNLIVVLPKANALGDVKPMYHSLLGTKILLALVLFAIMVDWLARASRSEAAAPSRSPAITVAVLLALLVLLLSATVRRMWDLDPRLKAGTAGSAVLRNPDA